MQECTSKWLDSRGAGILLHPSSLAGEEGIGGFGEAAFEFIEFLREAELTYWQVMPLEPPGYGHSPYQTVSCFAGNPLLIDLKSLMAFGLLTPAELAPLVALPSDWIDFGALEQIKLPLLRLVWQRFEERQLAYIPNYGLFAEFCENEAAWLVDYALYAAAKKRFGMQPWLRWPEDVRNRKQRALRALESELADEVRFQKFTQYLFFGQWDLLRRHARDAGLEVIGDFHPYACLDSADVWTHQKYFMHSQDGARFVFPLVGAAKPGDIGWMSDRVVCDWIAFEQIEFEPLLGHFAGATRKYDILRVLCFDGLTRIKVVDPAEPSRVRELPLDPTNLFDRIQRELPHARFIAETAGSPAARKLRMQLNAPDTAVLIHGFDGVGDHRYLPHNLQRNQVVYTSIHDSATAAGWYESAGHASQDQFRRYYRVSGEDVAWDLIRSAYRSAANLAIFTMQDVMSLGNEARMVFPESPDENWRWRMSTAQMEHHFASAHYLRELAWLYGR